MTEPSTTPTPPDATRSPAGTPAEPAAEAVVDLAAYRHNLRVLAERAAPAALMAVVKADAYGHGMVACAREARACGVPWLGVATLSEAVALREAGDDGRVLSWLAVPGEDYAAAAEHRLDVTASSVEQLADVLAAHDARGRTARLHLKIDTGLSRNGASADAWPALVAATAAAVADGRAELVSVWSHLACADEPAHPANAAQQRAFDDALAVVAAAGLRPGLRHLANSAGLLLLDGADYDLVRVGIASYGLSPAPDLAGPQDLGLRPVMTLQARLAAVREVAAGTGVSYGHTWTAHRTTRLGLVPAGYAEGVPRQASGRAEVGTEAGRAPLVGRVCMDQVVVDLGPGSSARPGDLVRLFGPGDHGEPTAQDWAEAAGTISYDVVTGVRGRVRRRWSGASAADPAPDVAPTGGDHDATPGGPR